MVNAGRRPLSMLAYRAIAKAPVAVDATGLQRSKNEQCSSEGVNPVKPVTC